MDTILGLSIRDPPRALRQKLEEDPPAHEGQVPQPDPIPRSKVLQQDRSQEGGGA